MAWNLYQIGQNIERSPTKNRNDIFKKIFECMCDKIPLISRLPESEGQTFEGKKKKKGHHLAWICSSQREDLFLLLFCFLFESCS